MLRNKLSPNSAAWNTPITASFLWVWELPHWVLWLSISPRLQSGCLTRGCSHLQASPGNGSSPNSFTWLLAGFGSSWAVTRIPPPFLEASPPGSSHTAACSIRTSDLRRGRKESVSKTDITVFCDLISKVAAHPFCYILLLRSRPLGPATPLGVDGVNTKGGDQ